MALRLSYLPRSWKSNKSVLPKNKFTGNPAAEAEALSDIQSFRPITISSVLCRAFHKVILKMKKQRAYMTMMDIKSSFDTLSHSAISEKLVELNCPETLRKYIMNSYVDIYTKFSLKTGETSIIPIKRGVKQGDLLSSFIFAVCLDKAVENLVSERDSFIHRDVKMTQITTQTI
ncbi:hypothetical protein GJ496_002159 [Pomphorhynchus laevis]|nr:hypothetical protein GJ496_002159 [Pomphorhynchus laevis]